MLLILIIVLILILFYITYNTIENFTCCGNNDNYYKNLYQDKQPFENERRVSNILSYELNPPYEYQ